MEKAVTFPGLLLLAYLALFADGELAFLGAGNLVDFRAIDVLKNPGVILVSVIACGGIYVVVARFLRGFLELTGGPLARRIRSTNNSVPPDHAVSALSAQELADKDNDERLRECVEAHLQSNVRREEHAERLTRLSLSCLTALGFAVWVPSSCTHTIIVSALHSLPLHWLPAATLGMTLLLAAPWLDDVSDEAYRYTFLYDQKLARRVSQMREAGLGWV